VHHFVATIAEQFEEKQLYEGGTGRALDASIQAPYATQARRTSNLFLLRSFRSPWEIMRE
jgi:hypothetical protein